MYVPQNSSVVGIFSGDEVEQLNSALEKLLFSFHNLPERRHLYKNALYSCRVVGKTLNAPGKV